MNPDLFATLGTDDWRHTTIVGPWGTRHYRAMLFADATIVEVQDPTGPWVRVKDRRTIDEVLGRLREGV